MKRRITVVDKDDKYRSVDAYVYGDWAAHSDGAGWNVTLLIGGRRANTEPLSESGARRTARWLADNITRDEILDWGELSVAVSDRIRHGIELGDGGDR